MNDYLGAVVVVIVLFISGLASATIVYYAVQIIVDIKYRYDPSKAEQSILSFFAWPFALLAWAVVDYFLYQFIKSSFYW